MEVTILLIFLGFIGYGLYQAVQFFTVLESLKIKNKSEKDICNELGYYYQYYQSDLAYEVDKDVAFAYYKLMSKPQRAKYEEDLLRDYRYHREKCMKKWRENYPPESNRPTFSSSPPQWYNPDTGELEDDYSGYW